MSYRVIFFFILNFPPSGPFGGLNLKQFGDRVRNATREDERLILPPFSRLIWRSNRDPPEIRLGTHVASQFRYVYGFIGLIERLKKSSANTTTSFMCHVITKITWINRDGSPGACYARVLAYSSNFSAQDRANEALISIRDFVQGYVVATSGTSHSGANLGFWRFADLAECQTYRVSLSNFLKYTFVSLRLLTLSFQRTNLIFNPKNLF